MRRIDKNDIFNSMGLDYKTNLKNQIDELATELIYKKYPQHKQMNASLGLYNDDILKEMKLYISQIIRISSILKKRIDEEQIVKDEDISERLFLDYL